MGRLDIRGRGRGPVPCPIPGKFGHGNRRTATATPTAVLRLASYPSSYFDITRSAIALLGSENPVMFPPVTMTGAPAAGALLPFVW